MVRRISARVRRAGHGVVGGVRRDHRHFLARMRHRLELGARDLVGAEQAVTRHAVEHAVAGAHGRGMEAVRPAKLRRLRQRHEKRGLAERQPLRLLAEIRERGCPDAFEISAIRRERQIEAKDLVLAELALELDGAHRLPELDVERALRPRLEQARDLHGDGRAAGDDLSMCDRVAARRGRRRADRRPNAGRSACPHRRAARRDNAGRPDRAWQEAASGPGSSHRSGAICCCGRPRSWRVPDRGRAGPDRTQSIRPHVPPMATQAMAARPTLR